MTSSPYNLEALLAKVREGAPAREKPLPCETWCSLAALVEGRSFALGAYCTCQEACQWESCPADVEAYVPPPVPTFHLESTP